MVKTDGNYEMWFTRADTDLTVANATTINNELNNLGLGALLDTLQTGDYTQFLTDFLDKTLDPMTDLLTQTSTVIGYATSANGSDWTVVQDTDLEGVTRDPWSSVAAPSVIPEGTGYRMWFTEGAASLDLQALLDLALGDDFPIGMATFTPSTFFGGGGPPPPPPGTTVLTGLIDEDGVFLEEIIAPSEDELVWLTIPEGTVGLTAVGQRVPEITIVEMEEPPPAPSQGNVLGLVYEFGPEGATFDPPTTITFTYDPALVPDGVAESELKIALWDADADPPGWVQLDTVVDTNANTLSAQVAGFSVYGVFAPEPAAFELSTLSISPPEIEAGDDAIVTITVTNTGQLAGTYLLELTFDGEAIDSAEVTLAGGESREVSFTVSSRAIGPHNLSIAGESASLNVMAKIGPTEPEPESEEPEAPEVEVPVVEGTPDISMLNLSVTPVQVGVGETVIISILVINSGDAEGSHDVRLVIDGSTAQTKTVTLAANATRTVTFTLKPDTPGTHKVEIDDLSANLTVREALEDEEPAGINPLIVGAIIAGAALVGAVIVLFVMRRREREYM